MEKPDGDGYVNITWPSKAIPYGGIFHTRVVEPSANQQQFLKVLLEESKLDIAQRRKSALALRRDDRKPEPPPRVQLQSLQMVRPRTSRRRSLSAIRESGVFEIDPYCPMKRGEDREKLKDKLAKFMECGDSTEQIHRLPPPPPIRTKPKLPTAKERWDDLVTQIRERAEWLAEMEYLGGADPHREIINDQIAERMRALDALGVDSQCSSARSTKSGFSTTRSKEPIQITARSVNGGVTSVHSNHSTESKCAPRPPSVRDHKKEENVAAYSQMHTPLKYSQRRRV